jgi:predicted lipoprotein with Yx(FWY)xxD motif
VAATVSTGTATVSGKSVTVLTDAATGKTLYYRTTDTSTSVTCTGGCAGAWPPLMPPASGQPTSSAPLPAALTVLNGADGKQVLYNGHPLYGFKSDNAPGQATGQGVASFLVVTPDVAAAM